MNYEEIKSTLSNLKQKAQKNLLNGTISYEVMSSSMIVEEKTWPQVMSEGVLNLHMKDYK